MQRLWSSAADPHAWRDHHSKEGLSRVDPAGQQRVRAGLAEPLAQRRTQLNPHGRDLGRYVRQATHRRAMLDDQPKPSAGVGGPAASQRHDPVGELRAADRPQLRPARLDLHVDAGVRDCCSPLVRGDRTVASSTASGITVCTGQEPVRRVLPATPAQRPGSGSRVRPARRTAACEPTPRASCRAGRPRSPRTLPRSRAPGRVGDITHGLAHRRRLLCRPRARARGTARPKARRLRA
jgi:hypothetical protein